MKQVLRHFFTLALSALLLLPTACMHKYSEQPVDQSLTTDAALEPDTALIDTPAGGRYFKPQHRPGLKDNARAKKIEQEVAPLREKIKNTLAGDDDLEVGVFEKIIADTLCNKDLSQDAKIAVIQAAISCIHSLDSYEKKVAMNSLRNAIKYSKLPAENIKSLNFLVLGNEIGCHIQKHPSIELAALILKIGDYSLPNGEAIEFLGQILEMPERDQWLKTTLTDQQEKYISWWLQANSKGEYNSDLIKCLQQPVLMKQLSVLKELLSDFQRLELVFSVLADHGEEDLKKLIIQGVTEASTSTAYRQDTFLHLVAVATKDDPNLLNKLGDLLTIYLSKECLGDAHLYAENSKERTPWEEAMKRNNNNIGAAEHLIKAMKPEAVRTIKIGKSGRTQLDRVKKYLKMRNTRNKEEIKQYFIDIGIKAEELSGSQKNKQVDASFQIKSVNSAKTVS